MNFRAKIWMLPLSAAALFVIGSGVSFAVGTHTVAALDHLREVDYPVLESMTKIERTLEQFRLSLQSAAAEGDESKVKEAQALAETAIAGLSALEKLEGQGGPAAALKHAFQPYQSAAVNATRAMLKNAELGDQLALMQTTLQALDKQQAASKKAATDGVTRAQDAVAAGVRRNLWVGLGTGIAVLLVLGIASRFVLASVWRDLGAEPALLRHRVQQIADGDLSSQDAAMTAALPGSLGRALASMGSQLSATVGQIRQSSDSIATASGEIASGNRDLNQRTEHAASNLQQAASSMQHLAGTVRQSAEAAAQANQLANAAADAARDGGGIVAQVVANMQEINDASRRITEIIGVIDGIAFQTNILALNAAVEAARAGEQGRGFAVVATEVRSLAQRCTQAAKEIKGLIGLSSSKVDSGARLVGEAGTAMQKIVDGVQRVSDIIGEISAATTAQSSGIGSITDSVGQLDRMTQQNASMVAHSATAAGSLREEADRLAQAVGVFKLQEVA